jgi:hypothetical protein
VGEQSLDAVNNAFKHRLRIGHRLNDHLQKFRCRRLMRQGFVALGRAFSKEAL